VSVTETIVFDSLEDYSAGHSSPPPSFYPEIEFNTKKVHAIRMLTWYLVLPKVAG
jgi:hypothetical protein